jgi:phage-related baseplate assembly protein
MVARFLAPDLTQLSPAALIEEIDAEVILAAQKTFVLARWEELRQTRPDLPALDTLGLETELMTILLEAFAYRETLLRALVNDKACAVLLTYATGSDLDHLGALFATYRTRHAEVNRYGLFYDATVDDDAKKSGKWDQLRAAGIVVR